MVISKRNFLKGCGASVLAVATFAPLKVEVPGSFPSLAIQAAFAKNENSNGGGNGNGNGGGGGNGNSGGNSNSSGNSRSSSNGAGSANNAPSTSGVRASEATDGSIDVRHTNGITETLRAGRYIMKDGKGRTIINRRATSADGARLARLLR